MLDGGKGKMAAQVGEGSGEPRAPGRLVGRVAVVTGASRGIGRAIATRYADEGAMVVASARSADDLAALVDELNDRGTHAVAVVADASDANGARLPVRTALEQLGRVDVLVNNVGGSVGDHSDPATVTDEAFEATLTLTLLSSWRAAQEALPAMQAQGYGRIVNIGSGSSFRAGAVAYATAKHALVGLTRSLAAATGTQGITVNCLCPGWTQTSFNWEDLADAAGTTVDAVRQRAEGDSAQRRVLGPEELAGMATLLGSADGAGITGQVIAVDGGYKL